MSNSSTLLRSLLVYSLVLPLALFMGYQLASTDPARDPGTWLTIGSVLLLLAIPLLMRWHYPLLLLSWNSAVFIFFLPGQLQLWLIMAFMSLGFSIMQRASSRDMQFISVPSLSLPLIFLAAVILITMRANGDFGVRALGSQSFGGKRYVMLLGAIAGFFAFLAHKTPPQKIMLCMGLFLLGSAGDILSMVYLLGPPFDYILWVFPYGNSRLEGGQFGEGILRSAGLSSACAGVFYFVLARYGLRETLRQGKYWRLAVLAFVLVMGSLAGFRSYLVPLVLTFLIMFYLEGLLRSKYTVLLLLALVCSGVLLVPLANKLPLSMQRTLSFLPIDVDPMARYSAAASTEWRLQMWQRLLPEIPRYLWLGKGLGMKGTDLELTSNLAWQGQLSSQEVSLLAGDYHSGPLSVIIPFGIWGAIGFLWFLVAASRALYLNYRYSDESLKTVNTLLLAYFLARIFHFIVVFGGFYSDLAQFVGIIGLSLSLNGGICRASRSEPLTDSVPFRFRERLRETAALPEPANGH